MSGIGVKLSTWWYGVTVLYGLDVVGLIVSRIGGLSLHSPT